MSRAQASVESPARAVVARLRGLYAITPDETDTDALVDKVRMALAGGASLVQYRNKAADTALQREQGAALLALCRATRVPLIINDDLELAASLDADGLHLGGGDTPIAVARAQWSRDKILGASCYDRLSLAFAARDAGADYVAFGSAFPSRTKPGAVRAPVSLYREAKAQLTCPVVAIGGITASNAQSLIRAGVDALAVIGALFGAPDVERRAREFAEMFNVDDLEERSAV
jgi:thiamine-phosphate pyrophosphorylase